MRKCKVMQLNKPLLNRTIRYHAWTTKSLGMVHIIPACVGLPGANSAMAMTASFRTSESVSRSRAATALAN